MPSMLTPEAGAARGPARSPACAGEVIGAFANDDVSDALRRRTCAQNPAWEASPRRERRRATARRRARCSCGRGAPTRSRPPSIERRRTCRPRARRAAPSRTTVYDGADHGIGVRRRPRPTSSRSSPPASRAPSPTPTAAEPSSRSSAGERRRRCGRTRAARRPRAGSGTRRTGPARSRAARAPPSGSARRRFGHRVRNRQPLGGCIGDGISPPSTFAVVGPRPRGRAPGSRRAARRCTGAPGWS